MKKRISISGAFLIISITAYLSGMTAFAAEGTADEFSIETISEEVVFTDYETSSYDEASYFLSEEEIMLDVDSLLPEDTGEDNDEMFAAYVEAVMTEDENTVSEEASFSARRAYLDNVGKNLYDLLKDCVVRAADGERSDTSFRLKLSDIFGGSELSPSDIGLSTIFTDSTSSKLTDDAYKKLFGALNSAVSPVLMGMLDDMPYEMYWFDKTAGWKMSGHMTYRRDGNNIVFPDDSTLTVMFYVSKDYSAEGTSYTTKINTGKAGAAKAAKANAKLVVKAYADKSDYEKLDAYREEICKRVEYDYAAISKSTLEYGDPWQIINVFDNNSSTNVVCEGYSKAFQLLCDLSEFSDESIECHSIVGNVNGGTHMWNLVHMDNGQNYLVDLTNCDEGTYGYPDKLFMKGDPNGTANGYTVATLKYDYEAGYAKTNFTDAERSISKEESYSTKKAASAGSVSTSTVKSGDSGASQTSTGTANSTKSSTASTGSSEEKFEAGISAGWKKSGGKWYYLTAEGKKITGWLKINNKWYYLNKKGVRQTGWTKVGKKWYYMNKNGVMQKGWKTINGKKYYLNKNGVRVTGLKKISGKYYYFKSNGVMVKNKTLTIKGKTYTFGKNGAAKK